MATFVSSSASISSSTGKLPARRDGCWTLYDHRQKADYGGDVSDVEVEPLFEEVGDFVTHMAELVESDGSADS